MAHDTADGCIFCSLLSTGDRVIHANDTAAAFYDAFPVAPGHTLVVPRRHYADFFDMTADEAAGVLALLKEMRARLLAEDDTIAGFNVGVNVGPLSGQTVDHCHVHLIPRRRGDTPNPEGGVRGVIPEKRTYRGKA